QMARPAVEEDQDTGVGRGMQFRVRRVLLRAQHSRQAEPESADAADLQHAPPRDLRSGTTEWLHAASPTGVVGNNAIMRAGNESSSATESRSTDFTDFADWNGPARYNEGSILIGDRNYVQRPTDRDFFGGAQGRRFASTARSRGHRRPRRGRRPLF